MGELDLLSAEAYAEQRAGEELILRVTPIEPPQHPLGVEYNVPHWGVFASAHDVDPGWLVMFATPDPDGAIESQFDSLEARQRTERLSILIGASWAAVAASAMTVSRAQEAAVVRIPMAAHETSPEQLRKLRNNINAADPSIVATLLQMTYHWALDLGGTHGPRFFG